MAVPLACPRGHHHKPVDAVFVRSHHDMAGLIDELQQKASLEPHALGVIQARVHLQPVLFEYRRHRYARGSTKHPGKVHQKPPN